MRQNFWKFVLGLALLGCGGQPAGPPAGFVNQTKHSDADLWMIWQAAQDSVAHQVDLKILCKGYLSGRRRTYVPGADVRLRICPTSFGWAPSLM
jgi:hypothetical protein